MRHTSPPVFGKRNVRPPAAATAATAAPAAASVLDAIPPDQAAFFAAIRSELQQSAESRQLVVPRSLKAASLAGLVAGCALAGFDVTGETAAGRFDVVAGLFGIQVDASRLLPAMIALGLLSGARTAAMIVIGVHTLLSRVRLTGYAAYAFGGAAAAAAFSALMLVATGHPPAHGWLVEVMAGTGTALCYRAIAGAHAERR